MKLDGGQGPGDRGIGVAVDQDPVRLKAGKRRVEFLQHSPCHHTVAAAADAQVQVRGGDPQLHEE